MAKEHARDERVKEKEDLQMSKEKGNQIYKFLKNKGFENPLFGMSGNGVH